MLRNKKVKSFIIFKYIIFFMFIYLLFALFYKGVFYVNVYDEQTKDFVDMNYTDIDTSFNALCIGTPGTGESGYYMYEPKIALPGLITVRVNGYKTKTKFYLLGFNNEINIYLNGSKD